MGKNRQMVVLLLFSSMQVYYILRSTSTTNLLTVPGQSTKHCGTSRNEDGPLPQAFRDISFEIPPDQPFMSLGKCTVGNKTMNAIAQYSRSEVEWEDEQKARKDLDCRPSLEVLSWLMNQVICDNGTMMMAYGELIHMFREKALARDDGTYFDDDFDTWATPATAQKILRLEPILLREFGWSMRVFYNCHGVALFVQILPVCGHTYVLKASKAVAAFPAIELYILQESEGEQGAVLRDNWQGTKFPPSWIQPGQLVSFETPGYNGILELQVPADTHSVLKCLYGDWTVYSKQHAPKGHECNASSFAGVQRMDQ